MTVKARLRVWEVWAKEAYDTEGNHLGRVEAVGLERGGLIRRVAVPRPGAHRGALRFIAFDGVRLEGDRLVLPAAKPDPAKPLRIIH